MAVRITCINKQHGNHFDPHHAIENLGWLNEQTGEYGKCSREQMYDYLVKGGQAYVGGSDGTVAYLRTRISASGTRFVQTFTDNTWRDNLLYLRECV